jgi:energy-converting hydrogenase A subunit M
MSSVNEVHPEMENARERLIFKAMDMDNFKRLLSVLKVAAGFFRNSVSKRSTGHRNKMGEKGSGSP